MASTVIRPIPKRFKMLDISKYDGTSDPQKYFLFFTIVMNRNNLMIEEAESVMVKKFGVTLSGSK